MRSIVRSIIQSDIKKKKKKNLEKEGFYPIFADYIVFKNDILGIIIICHIDDLLVFGLNIKQINKI